MISKSTGENLGAIGGIGANELGLNSKQIAAQGMCVMIPGDTYHSIIQLIEQLLTEGAASPEGVNFLESIRRSMLVDGMPYRPNRIKKATQLPTVPMPGLPR